jgi:hypothetical protein
MQPVVSLFYALRVNSIPDWAKSRTIIDVHPAIHAQEAMMSADQFVLLSQWNQEILNEALLQRKDWVPYPGINDRQSWEGLPEGVKKALTAQADEALAAPWPHVPASIYLQFAQNGNRTNYEDLHFGRRSILCSLLLGECIQDSGKYLTAVMDAAWSICEESSWCLPAHIGAQKAGRGLPDIHEPILDLFASETGALLAWTVYLLGEKLSQFSPLLLPRIRQEIELRILEPGRARDDFGWMGFVERPVNNWNPWINSNWLACVLLIEENEDQRLSAVEKILRSLDVFLADYPEDGGCDEGPNYWGRAGASLFDCLELLSSASAGKLSAFSAPLVRHIGQYIYKAHIAGDYYLNFADASAVVQPDAMLVLRYGRQIGDDVMVAFGAWLAQRAGLLDTGGVGKGGRSSSPTRELPALFSLVELSQTLAHAPLLRDVWLPGIEVMAARDADGLDAGLYLAVKGGHNAESHNHNDIGHFVVYRDGLPLIIDAGVETYTRKTFSPQRYEIWTMQSAYHSLPTIDGVQQAPGREFRAREVRREADEAGASLTLDLAGAYPGEAGVKRWVRGVSLLRGREVRLADRFELDREAASLTLSLMTPCSVDLSQPGLVALSERDITNGRRAGTGGVHYDSRQFDVRVETVDINDARMRPVWGSEIYRIVFTLRERTRSGEWEMTIA